MSPLDLFNFCTEQQIYHFWGCKAPSNFWPKIQNIRRRFYYFWMIFRQRLLWISKHLVNPKRGTTDIQFFQKILFRRWKSKLTWMSLRIIVYWMTRPWKSPYWNWTLKCRSYFARKNEKMFNLVFPFFIFEFTLDSSWALWALMMAFLDHFNWFA